MVDFVGREPFLLGDSDDALLTRLQPPGPPDSVGFSRRSILGDAELNHQGEINVALCSATCNQLSIILYNAPSTAWPVMMRDAVAFWDPVRAAVFSRRNGELRTREKLLADGRLSGYVETDDFEQVPNWCNFLRDDHEQFGFANGLQLDAIKDDPQVRVQRYHGGTEIILGPEWTSAEDLLEIQRRVEPLAGLPGVHAGFSDLPGLDDREHPRHTG